MTATLIALDRVAIRPVAPNPLTGPAVAMRVAGTLSGQRLGPIE